MKYRIKIKAFIMVLAMVIIGSFSMGMFSMEMTVRAAEVIAEGDFEEDPYGDGGSAHWQLTSDGVLTISGTHPYGDCPWEEYRDQIVSADIQEGITYIPAYAFIYHANLERVSIPSSVKTIREKAFYGCTSLKEVSIPEGVESIYNEAFSQSGLVRITIPSSVNSLQSQCFASCENLTSAVFARPSSSYAGTGFFTFAYCKNLSDVTISEGVSGIGPYTFSGCSSLADIDIPGTVKNISSYAFMNCSALTGVRIPEGVTTVESSAFYGCSSLQSVSIPASLEVLGTPTPSANTSQSPFFECSNLAAIQVASQNGNFCFEDGILYNKDKTELYFCTNAKAGTSFAVPDHVEKIWNGAFSGCSKMASLKIPASVTSMKDNEAFGTSMFCPGLSGIEVDAGNPNYCSQDGVLYSKDKTTLEMYPPKKAGSSFIVPDGVKTIGKTAFRRSAVKNITFPKSVETIGSQVFMETVLTSITVLNPSCNISPEAYIGFAGDYDTIIYGYPGSTAEDFAERARVVFKVVGSDDNKQTPASGSSSNAKPKGTKITDAKSSGTYTVTAANTVAYAGPANASVTSVFIPGSITCEGVTYKVASVGAKAFKGNKKVKNIKMASQITKIADSAFENCTKLNNVTVAGGVTSIGKNAWKGCKNLKKITIQSKKLKTVGKNALKNINRKCKIKVPSAKLKQYKKLFKGKGQAKSVKITK